MKIGLVRHFEVDCSHEWLQSGEEFKKWAKNYDCSPVKAANTALGKYNWGKCYCSDSPRARETARCIYQGDIFESSLIREVPIMPVFKSNMRLPHVFWLIAGRIAWFLSHSSQPETIKQTDDKIEQFISDIVAEAEENVLVVTHGFLMLRLQKELKNRGFVGDNFKKAECGKLYLFEKEK